MRTLPLLLLSLILLTACPAAADTVTLKDMQVVDGHILGFDHYTLDLDAKGRTFHIPWGEVQSVSHTSSTAASDEQRFITGNPVEVTTYINPISRETVFHKSLYPGFFIHGWGHHLAHDDNRYYGLLAAELSGAVMAGFGLQEYLSNSGSSEDRVTSQTLSIVGGALFTVSWLYDVAFAGSAASRFNQLHQLSLAPARPGTVSLSYRF
jgi:hypothetical protein